MSERKSSSSSTSKIVLLVGTVRIRPPAAFACRAASTSGAVIPDRLAAR
jgi:hypothetical protein